MPLNIIKRGLQGTTLWSHQFKLWPLWYLTCIMLCSSNRMSSFFSLLIFFLLSLWEFFKLRLCFILDINSLLCCLRLKTNFKSLLDLGGLEFEELGAKLINKGCDNSIVFQRHLTSVTLQFNEKVNILKNGVHCFAHKTKCSTITF